MLGKNNFLHNNLPNPDQPEKSVSVAVDIFPFYTFLTLRKLLLFEIKPLFIIHVNRHLCKCKEFEKVHFFPIYQNASLLL